LCPYLKPAHKAGFVVSTTKLVLENPWAGVKVSVVPKQRPQPFTLAEISAIVQKFRSDSNRCHYADYVEFKFRIGLRTGEAAALL